MKINQDARYDSVEEGFGLRQMPGSNAEWVVLKKDAGILTLKPAGGLGQKVILKEQFDRAGYVAVRRPMTEAEAVERAEQHVAGGHIKFARKVRKRGLEVLAMTLLQVDILEEAFMNFGATREAAHQAALDAYKRINRLDAAGA